MWVCSMEASDREAVGTWAVLLSALQQDGPDGVVQSAVCRWPVLSDAGSAFDSFCLPGVSAEAGEVNSDIPDPTC